LILKRSFLTIILIAQAIQVKKSQKTTVLNTAGKRYKTLYLAMPNNQPPVTGKYIDPLVDFAFKKIFGSEPNKDLLIAFLNEVFRGRKLIVDLVYNKNEHHGDLKDEGAAIFDLLCTGE
jgi:hypothetical protein